MHTDGNADDAVMLVSRPTQQLHRLPGVGLFYDNAIQGVPHPLVALVRHAGCQCGCCTIEWLGKTMTMDMQPNLALHSQVETFPSLPRVVVFMTVRFVPVPEVLPLVDSPSSCICLLPGNNVGCALGCSSHVG